MNFASLLLLAVGLSMDAVSIAILRGYRAREILLRHILLVALFFGGFQALMPLLGWVVGDQAQAAPWIVAWDHWIVFGILSVMGLKMLHEAHAESGEESLSVAERPVEFFALRSLFLLAVATSLDALAVGFTLPLLDAPLLLSLVTIGVTAGVLSALGLLLGRQLGHRLGRRFDYFGGIVLIGMGTKILVEHLVDHGGWG